MKCCFNSEPCVIACGLWSERLQNCRFILAIDKILGDDGNRPVGLTPAEQTVMNLVAQGYKNKQISATLCISHQTVKNHVSSILMKFGATSRTEAVFLSLKNK